MPSWPDHRPGRDLHAVELETPLGGALGATLVHLVAEVMLPVLDNRGSFHLPPDLLQVYRTGAMPLRFIWVIWW
jgi:hypothetical protein